MPLLHGAAGFTSPPNEGLLQIFIVLKNPLPSVGFETANIGKHANHYTTETTDKVTRIKLNSNFEKL
jgi:hypothetical protein